MQPQPHLGNPCSVFAEVPPRGSIRRVHGMAKEADEDDAVMRLAVGANELWRVAGKMLDVALRAGSSRNVHLPHARLDLAPSALCALLFQGGTPHHSSLPSPCREAAEDMEGALAPAVVSLRCATSPVAGEARAHDCSRSQSQWPREVGKHAAHRRPAV